MVITINISTVEMAIFSVILKNTENDQLTPLKEKIREIVKMETEKEIELLNKINDSDIF